MPTLRTLLNNARLAPSLTWQRLCLLALSLTGSMVLSVTALFAQSGPLIFLPPAGYTSGGGGASVVGIADINGDGKLDMVVLNSGSGTVGVLLGNGDGTFRAAETYPVGGQGDPASMAIADLNGDGKPDLVVSIQCPNGNCTFGVVTVLLSNGNGSFQPAVTYNTGGALPGSISIADLNGDGKADIVVANYDSDGVGILLGNGDGTFQPALTYSSGAGASGAASVSIADLNGDKRPDLVVVSPCLEPCNEGAVSVLLGNGDGTFQPAFVYESGGQFATWGVIADVNGDGKPDLLVANYDPNTVAVMLGNGDGTFQSPVNYPAGGFDSFVAVADVNGDGKPDVIADATCCGGGWISVLLGNGDGTFQLPTMYYLSWAGGGSIAVADINGDGQTDVAVVLGDPNEEVGVLLNNSIASSSTTSMASSLNPVNVGESVTYTADVSIQSGGTPVGTVIFTDNEHVVSIVTLVNHEASYTTSYTTKYAAGSHSITAIYSGAYQSATGSHSAPMIEYVRTATTKTRVATSGLPSKFGQPVTFAATITVSPKYAKYGKIPDGDLVTFYDGSSAIGTGVISGGVATFTTSLLKVKTHIIKGVYAGDNTFEPSKGSVKQVVTK